MLFHGRLPLPRQHQTRDAGVLAGSRACPGIESEATVHRLSSRLREPKPHFFCQLPLCKITRLWRGT